MFKLSESAPPIGDHFNEVDKGSAGGLETGSQKFSEFLLGEDLVENRFGCVRSVVPRHVDVAVRASAHVAHEVISKVELPSAVLAEGLPSELGVRGLAHLSTHLVFKGRRPLPGKD
jgi:hypothetical protein